MENSIISAIKEKRIMEFSYNSHYRIVEPHIYGISNKIYELLGYQSGGSSSSGRIPDWRRYVIDDISNMSITDQHFPGRRQLPTSDKYSNFDKIIVLVDP